MSLAYHSRYLCALPGCGKYHKNGSKAQASCEAILRIKSAAIGQPFAEKAGEP